MQKESRLKQEVLAALKDLPNAWFTKIQQVAIRGTPDIIGTIHGVFVAIELKTREGKLSPLQAHTLAKIKSAHGFTFVLDPDNKKEILNHLKAFAFGKGFLE